MTDEDGAAWADLTPEQREALMRGVAQVEELNERMKQVKATPFDGSWLVDVPPYDEHGVKIERFEITERDAYIDQLRAAFNPQRADRSTVPGTYTRLSVDGTLWMTDTPAEARDHEPADWQMGRKPGGAVLIAGLGLGMVLRRAILVHWMRQIDVVETEKRVIDAVGPWYEQLAHEAECELRIHWADIHKWRPPADAYWDVGWFDIWPTINDDDMAEVTRLRNRFRRYCGWFGAWGQNERIDMRRRIKSGKWAY